MKIIITESQYERLSQMINEESFHIKKKNIGKFTATQKRTGKTTKELMHSKNPKTRQRAKFAYFAKRHWKPEK